MSGKKTGKKGHSNAGIRITHLQHGKPVCSPPSYGRSCQLLRGEPVWYDCIYWAVQKNLVKGCRQTLDCYCVSCELLSGSIVDTLWFVNMVCLPLIAEQNAHEICLTQECLQIVRRLLWKQTTTHSLSNNNPMFHGNLWPSSFDQPSISPDMLNGTYPRVGSNEEPLEIKNFIQHQKFILVRFFYF